MSNCPNCERNRRYAYAQMRLADRLHRRAQVAESALLKYIKAMQHSGGVHESLYQPKIVQAQIDQEVSDDE